MTLKIHNLLHRLGIAATYRGFCQSAYAVMLAAEDMERLLQVTKLLYGEVAKEFHTSFQCVERNIRTVAAVAWKENRPFLEALADHPLSQPPTPSQFIDILARQFELESSRK